MTGWLVVGSQRQPQCAVEVAVAGDQKSGAVAHPPAERGAKLRPPQSTYSLTAGPCAAACDTWCCVPLQARIEARTNLSGRRSPTPDPGIDIGRDRYPSCRAMAQARIGGCRRQWRRPCDLRAGGRRLICPCSESAPSESDSDSDPG